MTRQELQELIIKEFYNKETKEIDLSFLDFSGYIIDLSNLKADTIWNNNQKANDIWNDNQILIKPLTKQEFFKVLKEDIKCIEVNDRNEEDINHILDYIEDYERQENE